MPATLWGDCLPATGPVADLRYRLAGYLSHLLLASMGNRLTHVQLVAFFITAGCHPLLAASAIGAVGSVGMAGRPMSGAMSDLPRP
jgi:hypothetical protein